MILVLSSTLSIQRWSWLLCCFYRLTDLSLQISGNKIPLTSQEYISLFDEKNISIAITLIRCHQIYLHCKDLDQDFMLVVLGFVSLS